MNGLKVYPVYIEFWDHASTSAWTPFDDFPKEVKAVKCFALGWLVGQDKLSYWVSNEVSEDKEGGDNIAILKSTVIKFKKLSI